MLVTAPHERLSPGAGDFRSEAVQAFEIARHRVVVEVAPQDAAQPFSLLLDWRVTLFPQSLPNGRQRRAHPLLDGAPDDGKSALSGLAADVREAEKIKRLRLAQSLAFPVGSSVAAKLDQPRLLRMEFQSKALKAFAQVC